MTNSCLDVCTLRFGGRYASSYVFTCFHPEVAQPGE